jgi:RNA polymerase sigma-70 factor (ECF subfamily)
MRQPVSRDARGELFSVEDAQDQGDLLQMTDRNPAAFARLYDRHVQSIYAYLLAKTGDVADAEDLTSQTFLAAYEKLSKSRFQGRFVPWLFCIARNKLVDFYRKNKRHFTVHNLSQIGVELDSLHDIIQDEKINALSGLVKNLSETDFELLHLRLVTELTFQEIAVIQRKNEAAVKKAYYRLIERMKKDMEQVYE